MKSFKVAIASAFIAATVVALAGQTFGYPPFLAKARKFGAKDCTFCHVDPDGGPPWNDRGKWLITEKERRGAETVDVEWLADYKPGKAEDKKPAEQPAKTGDKPMAVGPVEQELMNLHRELIDAAKRQDPSVAVRLLADDVIVTGPTGQLISKAQEVAAVKQIKFDEYTPDDIKVRVYDEAAVMTYHFAAKGSVPEFRHKRRVSRNDRVGKAERSMANRRRSGDSSTETKVEAFFD